MQRYFEGWYFKQQSDNNIIAFIPAMHVEDGGIRSAFLQVFTREASYYVKYPYDEFSVDRRNFSIKIGNSSFTKDRIELDVHTDELTVTGTLNYGKNFRIRYDIMGFFKFLPLIECRHSVYSMYHSVNGSLVVNGKSYVFIDGTGYFEGDRGRSFPKRYSWTQCSWREESTCSLMLSVADIPYLGMKFTGVICVIIQNEREIRLATYLGAKIVYIGEGCIIIRQGKYTFSAELLEKNGVMLRAPVNGSMTRLIHENLSCRVRYRLTRDNEVLFDFISNNASFEYEYER